MLTSVTQQVIIVLYRQNRANSISIKSITNTCGNLISSDVALYKNTKAVCGISALQV